MKFQLSVLACTLFVASLCVNANGGGKGPSSDGRGSLCDRGGPGSGFYFDFFDIFFKREKCACEYRDCRGVIGTKVTGCPGSNQYRQCSNSSCGVQNCTEGRVWNRTLGACASCPAGQHVAANKQECVCDQGTTPDCKTGTCVACPTDSTQTADSCYCNRTTTAYDRLKHSCRACPANSTIRDQGCECAAKKFWNKIDWACQDCPGVWLPAKSRFPVCVCNGTNQIFNKTSVSCFTCPAGTTATFNQFCQCNLRYQDYNEDTGVCECSKGYTPNPTGTGCVRIIPSPRSTRSTSTSTARPSP